MEQISYPGLLNDILFKHVFSLEKYLNILLGSIPFLESHHLKNVKVDSQKYLDKIEYAHKAMYSDIVVETEEMIIDIEVQTSFDLEALNKSKAYAHALSGYQIKSGEKYKKVKPFIQIIFAKNVCDNLKLSNELLDGFHILNNHKKYYHRDDFQIYLVQVDKVKSKCYNENTRFRRLILMMNAKNVEELKKEAEGDEELMDMATEIEDFLYGKKAMDLFGDRKRFEEKYLEQGRSEGIEQTKEENARRMLLETNDYDFISRVTGLTIEQIKKLS